MGITSGRTLSHSVSLVGRARARLIHLTAAGALVGCLYGGFAFSAAVAQIATAHAATSGHAVVSVQPSVPCGAIPFPC